MINKDRLTAIIGIRVYPSFKSQLMEEAISKEKNLSEYVYEFIETGREQVNRGVVKQGNNAVKQ